ncbi:MAG TPA: hypothetical protein VIK89_11870 [Cytophagaceae bacterium]
MRSRTITLNIVYFVVFFLFQILIFRNAVLFNYSFCFIYIGAILLLPFETPHLLLMAAAFVLGFTVDIFYDTMGIHMAASVFMAYMRPYIVNFLTPKGGYDLSTEVTIHSLGIQWFLSYAGILVVIHHFALFVLESWGINVFFRLLAKTIFSSIFTLLVLTLFQYLFHSPRRYK